MQVVSAARWESLQDPTINGLVAGKVFRHRLEEKVEGTGGHALVIWRAPGWASPDRVKSGEYPVLVFDCYADPTRDGRGLIRRMDSEDKAWALRQAVDRRFHFVRDEWWGARGASPGLRVISCQRSVEPELIDARLMTDSSKTGDVSIVRARYALEI